MELNIALNANQLELYKQYRSEYAALASDIAKIQQDMKDTIEALIDGLGWDKKEHKQQIKALKKSLKMYVKQNSSEEEAVTTEAATLARV